MLNHAYPKESDLLGKRPSSPRAEYLMVVSLASLQRRLATKSSDIYSSSGIASHCEVTRWTSLIYLFMYGLSVSFHYE